jgi:2-polyprenyl-3-methyl-5-hydroxy-6-metoxy-1,4-benzoquinol methylase
MPNVHHFAQRIRKRANKHVRRLQKWATANGGALRSLWLRFDDEVKICPACGSTELTPLDVLRVRSDMTGRRLAFLTGCEACGLLFTNPLPAPEQAVRFYAEDGTWGEAHAERAARLAAAHERRTAQQKPHKRNKGPKRTLLFDAMQPYVPIDSPPPGAKAIDVGCGEGKLLNSLQDAGWNTYGIEPSTAVAFLRHQRLEAAPQDGSFDLAILHHVLEHVPNPLEILRQLAGSLRVGGILFISVPRLDTVGEHGDFRYCINGRNHLVSFTEACLRGLLARAGFEVAARLDAPELDRALTGGTPLRLRLLARRTLVPPPVPEKPLSAARRALAAYAQSRLPFGDRISSAVPSRLRAGWVQWKLAR